MSQKQCQNDKINTRQLAINMIFSVVAFVLNLGIGFFITPYITSQFGSDAYGFVKLANDVSNYASLFSIALNSMASRFLMLERARKNQVEAQKYFSSIFFANVVLSIILFIPSMLSVVFLERLLEIPVILVAEVKLTFAVTFVSFLVNLVFSTHSNCYYLTNKLSIGSIRDAITNILRVLVIVFLFLLSTPRISYVAIGGLISTIFAVIYNIIYTKKLTPELTVHIIDFEWRKLWKVLSSGIWNSVTKLSQIFSSGLDLIVTNLFIGSTEMGYLAVAKTVPQLIVSFNTTIANVFSPNMMELYAKGDMNLLRKTAKSAMKFMCLFVTIPNAILITMGKEFFKLWVPSQPAELLCVLSVLTVINSCVTGPLTPLYQIFTITNKVKQSSIVMVVYGFSSIFVTFICLKYTNLGLFAVAGVSLIGSLVVALCYHLPFAAIYIGLPWYSFFPEVLKGVITMFVQCFLGFITNLILPLEKSWVMWFFGATVAGVLGLITNICLILNTEEKRKLIGKI
ncbi:MAG: lipopolysaccharide biosynthesis protein [Oliverpabstia sp.]